MEIQSRKVDLFLDSGAYSVKRRGVTVNLQDYISYIKRHQKHIGVYANLDVIGDAEATLKNQQIMEAADLKPMPVFHYGEDLKYLKGYMENYEYIGIGGGSIHRRKWLDQIFINHLCDLRGYPKLKVHGFGITSVSLLFRYPWYSVDSSTWSRMTNVGVIIVPKKKKDKWVYDESPWSVTVSARSPKRKQLGQHFETLPLKQMRTVLGYIEMKGYRVGKSEFKEGKEIIIEQGLCNSQSLRYQINIQYFLDLEASVPKWPWSIYDY